jgi:two-component system, chemotaxis family, protein-glutamate methylesterase/glutaminase
MKKIKVLVIDDSAIVRDMLSRHLTKSNDLEIVGTAPDAYVARQKIISLKPDVLTLDIEMPKMDGITFLRNLMKSYPLPVIIVSSLLGNQKQLSMTALDIGAVDVVPKPGGPYSVGDIVDILVDKIKAASRVKFDRVAKMKNNYTSESTSKILAQYKTTKKIIAIGASTGGTIALEKLFSTFTPDIPPTLTVIHMPEGFTKTFANRLDGITDNKVKEAEDNERLMPGTIYIAPGNHQMMVQTKGTDFILKIQKGPKVNNCRPSVDVLFHSVASNVGKNSCGIILTGMGRDGAEGLLNIKKNGGYTIAQDENTSIVFGMPKEAIDMGATNCVLPLNKIRNGIVDKFLNN